VKRLSQRFLRRRAAIADVSAGWPPELQDVAAVKGWLSPDAAVLLYELARKVEGGCIVEVGSYRGRSTIVLARGAAAGNGVPVYAVEPHEPFVGVLGGEFGPEDRGAFFRNMLRTGAYENVRLLNTSSEVLSPGWREPVALLWLDGDHSYDGVRRDFDSWERHLLPGCDLALDDADDPELGPYRLIQELTDRSWRKVGQTGRVAHLRRKNDSGSR
jgi:Methyltransferase domain